MPDHDTADFSGACFRVQKIQFLNPHFFQELDDASEKHFIAVIVHSVVSEQKDSDGFPPVAEQFGFIPTLS